MLPAESIFSFIDATQPPKQPVDETQLSDERSPIAFKTQLIELLDKDDVTEEEMELKVKVINALSPDFIEEIYGHLRATDVENEMFSYRQISTEIERDRLIRGEVFESLVSAELNIKINPSQESQELAEEFLAFMRNPERFGLGNRGRNPDLTLVDVLRRQIIGVVDAKLSKLNERAANQISQVTPNIRESLRVLKETSDEISDEDFLNRYGLSPKIRTLKLAHNISRTFIMPRDKRGKPIDELVDNNFANAEKRAELINKIERNLVSIDFSVFSADEVVKFSRLIKNLIKEKYDLHPLP